MKKQDWRIRFLYWLRQVAQVEEGTVSPRWIMIIYRALFPLLSRYANQNQCRFDYARNLFIIGGVQYSKFMFDAFATMAKVGDKFEFVERTLEKDGTIMITVRTLGRPENDEKR